MANEKYVDRAVKQVAAFIRANLPTQLRQVETDQGLTANSLTDPVEVVEARVPFDTRSPLIEVYEESGVYESFSERLMVVDCSVVCSFTHDANVAAGELFVRRYMTALLRTMEQDATLGGTVNAAIPIDIESAVIRSAPGETTEAFALGVQVRLHQP